MGRDNSPRERQKRKLERKAGQRASYDRILIVTEGRVTEPNYFREIRSTFRLQTTNVQVLPGGEGTAPLQVVNYAERLFLKGSTEKNIVKCAFEKVYIVFDRDRHPSYFDALQKVESINRKYKNDMGRQVDFIAIASVPCFEIWFLLHFEDIYAFTDRGDILMRLLRYIPGYSKGSKGLFTKLRDVQNMAIERAEALRGRGYRADSDNPVQPFTDVDRLVCELEAFNKERG